MPHSTKVWAPSSTAALSQVARDEKLKKLISIMLPENREMRALCVKLGFKMFSAWKKT